jgi:hypothetical protein
MRNEKDDAVSQASDATAGGTPDQPLIAGTSAEKRRWDMRDSPRSVMFSTNLINLGCAAGLPLGYWEIVISDVLLRWRMVPDCFQKGMFSG